MSQSAPSFHVTSLTVEECSACLQTSPCVAIRGCQGSGKSQFAELLAQGLRTDGFEPLLQNAQAWLRSRTRAAVDDGSIDSEIVGTLGELARRENGCWIVDDAEILYAYASADLLANIGQSLADGSFRAIFVRNRFIREDGGWFRGRESLLYGSMPVLTIAALPDELASQAAGYYLDSPQPHELDWLVDMSGGLPGLMARLAPHRAAASNDPDQLGAVQVLADEAAQRLQLGSPRMQAIMSALQIAMLPPWPLLSTSAQADVGSLIAAGMLRSEYAESADPFQANFWKLVASRTSPFVASVRTDVQDAALELEILLEQAGVLPAVEQQFGLTREQGTTVAEALAASAHLADRLPSLVRPLRQVLAEGLGRIQLAAVADQLDLPPEQKRPSAVDRADSLLSAVGLRS